MRNKNTDDIRRNPRILPFLGKMMFSIFLFSVQFFQAQITVTEGAKIHIVDNTVVSHSGSTASLEGEIYITQGAEIYVVAPTDKNDKLAQQKISTPEASEKSALKIAEIQKEKKQKEKIASIKIPVSQKKEFFSTQKSDESFASDYSFSSNSVPIPTYQLKDFIDEKYQSSIFLGKLYVFETYFYTVENHKKQFQPSYFTRPPPYFV